MHKVMADKNGGKRVKMSDEEVENRKAEQADHARLRKEQEKAREERDIKRKAILKRLNLSDDEAKLLIEG